MQHSGRCLARIPSGAEASIYRVLDCIPPDMSPLFVLQPKQLPLEKKRLNGRK